MQLVFLRKFYTYFDFGILSREVVYIASSMIMVVTCLLICNLINKNFRFLLLGDNSLVFLNMPLVFLLDFP